MVREAMNGTGLQHLHRLLQPGNAKATIRKVRIQEFRSRIIIFQGVLLVLKNLAQEAGCRRALGQADIVGELTSMAMQSGQTLQQDQNNKESLVSYSSKNRRLINH